VDRPGVGGGKCFPLLLFGVVDSGLLLGIMGDGRSFDLAMKPDKRFIRCYIYHICVMSDLTWIARRANDEGKLRAMERQWDITSAPPMC